MSVGRSIVSLTVLTAAVAVLAGCTGGGSARTVPEATSTTSVRPATPAPGSRSAVPAVVGSVAVADPSDTARIAAAREAAAALGGRLTRGSGAPGRGPAIQSGSAALVGRDASGWLDTTVTSGAWTVLVTCTGTGRITAYAAAPSVLTRLDVRATVTPDTRGTGRTVVPCSPTVAFETGRPGPDGLEIRVHSEDATPLTGVAFRLSPAA